MYLASFGEPSQCLVDVFRFHSLGSFLGCGGFSNSSFVLFGQMPLPFIVPSFLEFSFRLFVILPHAEVLA